MKHHQSTCRGSSAADRRTPPRHLPPSQAAAQTQARLKDPAAKFAKSIQPSSNERAEILEMKYPDASPCTAAAEIPESPEAKHLRLRNKATLEMLNTEETYVALLDALVTFYVYPLIGPGLADQASVAHQGILFWRLFTHALIHSFALVFLPRTKSMSSSATSKPSPNSIGTFCAPCANDSNWPDWWNVRRALRSRRASAVRLSEKSHPCQMSMKPTRNSPASGGPEAKREENVVVAPQTPTDRRSSAPANPAVLHALPRRPRHRPRGI